MSAPTNLGPAGRIVWDMAEAHYEHRRQAGYAAWDDIDSSPKSNFLISHRHLCLDMIAAIRAMPLTVCFPAPLEDGETAGGWLLPSNFAAEAEADLRNAGVL